MSYVREFRINKEPLFPAKLSGNAVIERTLEDGTIIKATVANSQIVGLEAFDPDGKRIPVSRMTLSVSNSPQVQPESGPNQCFYCICNPGCQCWPEPCPVA